MQEGIPYVDALPVIAMNSKKPFLTPYRHLIACVFTCCLLALSSVLAVAGTQQAAKAIGKDGKTSGEAATPKSATAGPVDEYQRGTPRTSVKQFYKATRDGDFERASEYLDLRNLPPWMNEREGPELARQLKILLDRTIRVDPELLSADPAGNLEDGQHPGLENIGRIRDKYSDRSFNILLQHVPRSDGVYIWKFSGRTVADIPQMYRQFGYKPFEEKLSNLFPDITFLGWHMWQWFVFVVFIGLSFLIALLLTWVISALLRSKPGDMRRRTAELFSGPLRIILFFLILYPGIQMIGPSSTIRSIMQAGTLWTIGIVWALIRMTELLLYWWARRLQGGDETQATVLLRPVRNILVIIILLLGVLVWLSNIGFNVTTLLTGLGVGGIAVALAMQDTLKNFFASIMILLDKPYQIGQRIVVKGHDGLVEEIGLRSTKLRLLNGHQATIPNDQMANLDIENVGRRPHIRRLTNINLSYGTSPEKIEKAIEIILGLLKNHEGMDPSFPARVYFNEFNRDSLNLVVYYWYRPDDYWRFLKFSQEVNLQIIRAFKKENIEFAFPTSKTFIAHEEGDGLQVQITGDSVLKDPPKKAE